jgi:hypothetical protein
MILKLDLQQIQINRNNNKHFIPNHNQGFPPGFFITQSRIDTDEEENFMIFIGFIAEKESGKTTTFNFIKDQIPEAQEVMLAAHLKEACAKVFNMELYKLESQEERKRLLDPPIVLTKADVLELARLFEMDIPNDLVESHIGKELMNTRQILQYVGTDILRAVEDDIHLKWAMRRAPSSSVYVVTDIRFPNEFDFFAKKDNFESYYIERTKPTSKDEAANHASESHISTLRKRCKDEILNNSTLVDLKNQVEAKIVPKIRSLLSK